MLNTLSAEDEMKFQMLLLEHQQRLKLQLESESVPTQRVQKSSVQATQVRPTPKCGQTGV